MDHLISIRVSGGDSENVADEIRKKYPDEKVSVRSAGDLVEISVDPKLPLQLKTDIGSFLNEYIRRSLH